MADEIKKIKIKELPQTTSISDDDIFVESDTLETYKVTADDIAKYISTNTHLIDKYVPLDSKGVANGVAPLNSNKKIDGTYITYGTASNTAYEGSSGKILETNLDNHLTDDDAHGYNTKIENEVTRAKSAESALETNLNNEITRAKEAENNLDSNKLDKTAIATSTSAGLVKSGTDITVDSSGNVSVNDDSHNHIISNVDGLQSALDTKAPSVSPTFTGTPKAPTASAGTNTTQIASTAFAQTAVSNHNTSSIAHSDIRDLISGLTTKLNALADSDDTTLDQLSEIVAYIKNNRELIESITTSKINVSDIVDNLISTSANKPLSANQGKVLKGLIDTLEASIPTVGNGTITITQNGTTRGTFTTNQSGNTTIELTDNNTVYAHPSYTARTGVPTENQTPAFGGTFTISQPVSDSTGHITVVNSRTVTIPNETASTSVAGLMSASDKNKLNGIATGAEVNQNAFGNIVVGSTTIAADSKTDSLTLVGSNVTLTPDATNDKVTIEITKDNVVAALGYEPGTGSGDVVTYELSKTGSTITLIGSDGSTSSVTDNNNTYSLNSFGVTATAAELNIMDGVTATATEINKLDGLTATTTELNYVDGVTSNIQTQLDKKAPIEHTHDYTDTKNTAGSTNSSSKLFLVGATSQAANPQTYSHDTAFVGTDGCLYSNSTRVVSEVIATSEPSNQVDGDYWLLDY